MYSRKRSRRSNRHPLFSVLMFIFLKTQCCQEGTANVKQVSLMAGLSESFEVDAWLSCQSKLPVQAYFILKTQSYRNAKQSSLPILTK